jgi:hypothetical protein
MLSRLNEFAFADRTYMRTILDEAETWFLHSLVYNEELRITLVEGMSGTEPEDICIGGTVIRNTYPIDTSLTSKLVSIRFPQYVAWQVVNESFTTFDEYEQRDDTGFLQTLERSKYLDYVNANHGWYIDVIGSGKHYRIWTESEVIDVVACTEPVIDEIEFQVV